MDFKEKRHPNSTEGTDGRGLTMTNPRGAGWNEHQLAPSTHDRSQPYVSPLPSNPKQTTPVLKLPRSLMQVDEIHYI